LGPCFLHAGSYDRGTLVTIVLKFIELCITWEGLAITLRVGKSEFTEQVEDAYLANAVFSPLV